MKYLYTLGILLLASNLALADGMPTSSHKVKRISSSAKIVKTQPRVLTLPGSSLPSNAVVPVSKPLIKTAKTTPNNTNQGETEKSNHASAQSAPFILTDPNLRWQIYYSYP